MRRSWFSLMVSLVVAGIPAGCTLGICARNSECATGQVCTAAGACAIPADASTDGQANDAGSTALADASTDAAPDADTSGGGAP